ncbi:sugar phosphate isomerase/epimerase family protein [Paenibacillus sp. GCM10027626]|uniref:sugar phosphate isomerase/epimerase family protein n=1 Tax=Paenibacillus sp. GCM10027626 TaxID=3273411 RepID=UPI0036420BF5
MVKLSVFTVATPDVTPDRLCEIAQSAGIEGIEWRCKETAPEQRAEQPSFWGNNLSTINPAATEEEIAVFKNAAEKYGRKAIALTPYIACGDMDHTEQAFALANKFGATMVRVGVPGYNRTRHMNDLLAEADAYLQQVAPLAHQYGVKALIETHHFTIAPSASLAYRLVHAYNPDHVGVLFDPGNMVHEGFENYRMGMELLGPYLAHVHVKNAVWTAKEGHVNTEAAVHGGIEPDPLDPIEFAGSWRPVASGIVPWKQVLADLRAVGYDGWLGAEDFSNTYDTETMLRNYAAQMRAWMEE